ncbi:MAG: type II toxin-antitoxin system Phd/YefM family antitoxin [Actinomycetota bacterium]
MASVGIRALKQNASAVVARAAAGERVIITDNGSPVAQILPLSGDRLADLDEAGLLRPATRTISDVGPPPARGRRRPLGDVISEMRDEDSR